MTLPKTLDFGQTAVSGNVQHGKGGPRIKANGAALEVRDAADGALAVARAAPGVGPTDVATVAQLPSAGGGGLSWLITEAVKDGTGGSFAAVSSGAAFITTGAIFFVTRSTTIAGVKLYWQTSGVLSTMRVGLYIESSALPVATIDVPVNATGVYSVSFGAPYTVAGADVPGYVYAAAFNDTASVYTKVTGGTATPLVPFVVGPGIVRVSSSFAIGDARPDNTGGEVYPLDLLTS